MDSGEGDDVVAMTFETRCVAAVLGFSGVSAAVIVTTGKGTGVAEGS